MKPLSTPAPATLKEPRGRAVRAVKPLPAPRFPFVKGRLPPTLSRCPGCGLHLYAQAKTCPHCGGSLAVLRRAQLKALRRAEAAVLKLQAIFARNG